jgi:polyphenol oxidase
VSGAYARGNLADHVGDSAGAVVINRALLQDALGAHRGLAVIAAVHGASTAWVNAAGTYGDVDGLLTEVEGLGILALGADCAVVGVAATRLDGTPVIGVAHCGWRGLVADAVGTLVGQIQSAGGRDLHAILGPTICGACYLIDEERSRQVTRRVYTRCWSGFRESSGQVRSVSPRHPSGGSSALDRVGSSNRVGLRLYG